MTDHADIDHTGLTGVGGSVATDSIWDAAGDLAVGSGANTAAKLTKGADGTVLTVTAGTVGWAAPGGSGVTGGSLAFVRLTADRTNSTTSLADVTGLSFSVTSGTWYGFEFHMIHQTGSAGNGALFSVNGPAFTTLVFDVHQPDAATTEVFHSRATYDSGTAATNGTGATNRLAIIRGIVLPSASGTLIVRFASEAGGTTISVFTGSYGILRTLT